MRKPSSHSKRKIIATTLFLTVGAHGVRLVNFSGLLEITQESPAFTHGECQQRRGYRLVEVYMDAVQKAREIKPEIPLISDNGIPIHDEILLVKML